MSGISKKVMLAFFKTPTIIFPCDNWQVPTGYHGNILIKKGPPFLYYVESWWVEEGFIGIRPALSPGRWGFTLRFSFDQGPTRKQKSG
jgi:hypothetical protein